MESVKTKWDKIYSQDEAVLAPPASVLMDNAFLLPASGTALDLACGLGGNAVFLARHGLKVEAWDISSIAIEKVRIHAKSSKLAIKARSCEINNHSLLGQCFDVIAISRYLDRDLSDAIIDALKPGGLLFYQTYTREKTHRLGPNNPDYLLAENELLRMFSRLKLIFYRENGCIGDAETGLRNEAQLIGQKYD